jgi:hypothetical protein
MIFKRAVAKLRAQDWAAITIEVAIVIIGVFIGMQVSNWNQERLERRETQQLLARLKPELDYLLKNTASARAYYGVARAYADRALAGWQRDPRISDRDFVIAAYQASQIYETATNNAAWGNIFGADRLRKIEDPALRSNIAFLMYADMRPTDTRAVDTPYRQNVRRVIPVGIQDAIRARCGDQRPADNPQLFYLPAGCHIVIPAKAAAEAAAALRARPELIEDLRWHTAAQAAFVNNTVAFEIKTRQLKRQVDDLVGR